MVTATKEGRINPKKYGMIFCPYCHGTGRMLSDSKGLDVCKVCGGFGAIKKEGKNNLHNGRVPVH